MCVRITIGSLHWLLASFDAVAVGEKFKSIGEHYAYIRTRININMRIAERCVIGI